MPQTRSIVAAGSAMISLYRRQGLTCLISSVASLTRVEPLCDLSSAEAQPSRQCLEQRLTDGAVRNIAWLGQAKSHSATRISLYGSAHRPVGCCGRGCGCARAAART